MNQRELMELRRQKLKAEITAHLDLLIGSVHKTPSQRGYHLTTKIAGKSATKYVRQELAPQAQAMTANHRQVRKLLHRLSDLNWRWLQRPTVHPNP